MIRQIDISDEEIIKVGRMEKSPFDMTAAELEAWRIQERAHVREYLFSIGQPLVYKKDGVMIAEYSDGTVVKL